jgi:tetratricopeptide (TPR) repeat protein
MLSRRTHAHRGWLALLLALGLVAAPSVRAVAAPDAREIQAREDFAAGRYQQAAEIFARLYAETLHPNYLRNIGRCYQNLGDADRAITSFRDYLRKAKSLSADERTEIEGYIKEMQELKRSREGGAAKPPAEDASPARTGAPAAAAPPPAPKAPPPPPAETKIDLTAKAPPPVSPVDESPPIYERWWFWAAVVGVVGAGVGVAAAAGAFTHTNDASCPMRVKCGM